MRESSPTASRMPTTNSVEETSIAVGPGAGKPRLAKKSVTRGMLCSFAQPFCEICQPQYSRTTSRKGDCRLDTEAGETETSRIAVAKSAYHQQSQCEVAS